MPLVFCNYRISNLTLWQFSRNLINGISPCWLSNCQQLGCYYTKHYIPTWSICSFVQDTFRPSQPRAFINFYWLLSVSTVDRRVGRLRRKRHRPDRFYVFSLPINRVDLSKRKGRMVHGGGQKMRVASRVTSEHGLACSARGVRPPSPPGFVLSNVLCVHTPVCRGILIYPYICLYTRMPIYTNARIHGRDYARTRETDGNGLFIRFCTAVTRIQQSFVHTVMIH